MWKVEVGLSKLNIDCAFVNPPGWVNHFLSGPEDRKEFRAVFAGGDYVRFDGVSELGVLNDAGELDATITDVVVLERGNIYDKQGAD